MIEPAGNLRIELMDPPDSGGNLDVFAALSGRRIPLWFLSGEGSREVLITRISSDGGSPQRITVEAHFVGDLPVPELPTDVMQTFLGWRVEAITEQ